jgi:NAD(P)-dependent dehydrogenase (short-subunit alcohol dehydrogenase family)
MTAKKKHTQLRDDVALVTGSRRGIGLGIARELAAQGFKVIVNSTSDPEAAANALDSLKTFGVECGYVQADISDGHDRANLVSEIKKQYGRLDVLVNNAGVAPLVREDILIASEESFDRLMRINLKGPYFLTQAIANWMIAQKRANPDLRPKIINISSVSAFTASPSRGEYCVSKAGVSMMTALYAARLAEYGIGVFEIRPGVISTDMTAKVKDHYDELYAQGFTPINRWGYPEDIGRAVSAVALDHFPFSTGEVIHVDGGFHLRTL